MSFIASLPEEKGGVVEIFRPFPELATPLAELTQTAMRGEQSPFSDRECELIAAFTSGVNECTYCYGTHRATAEAFGVEPELFDALFSDVDTAPVDDAMKPILKFVRKLTESPTRMTQADADAIFAAGWDRRAFHYAILICGLFNLYNRMLEGYGIKSTPEARAAGGRRLFSTGYLAAMRGG